MLSIRRTKMFKSKTKEPCPLCGQNYSFGNSKFKLDSNDTICTKCVILLAGILKKDQNKLRSLSIGEVSKKYQQALESKDKRDAEKQKILESFNVTRYLGTLEIDENSKTFRPGGQYHLLDIRPLSDILSYDLIENGSTVSSGGLGRAAVGAMAFGGAGAIVGAVTGKKKQTKLVNELRIKLGINDIDNPVLYINLIDKPIKSSSSEYSQAMAQANKIISTLDVLTAGTNEANNESPFSAADEIRKFKSLLDDGIITQEEFEAKKKELINM